MFGSLGLDTHQWMGFNSIVFYIFLYELFIINDLKGEN